MSSMAEVAEKDAAGNTRAIYADIRAVLGVPFVNLIYRHLATNPLVLESAWQAIRPHLASGVLQEQAAQLRHAVGVYLERAGIGAAQPTQDGIPADAIRLIHMYNAANSLNLMGLLHLLHTDTRQAGTAVDDQGNEALENGGPVSIAPANNAASRTVSGMAFDTEPSASLPPLPAFLEMSGEDLALVEQLNRYAEPGPPAMVASLYRHLSAWPRVLPRLQEILAPLQAIDVLTKAREQTLQVAKHIAVMHVLPMPRLVDEFYNGYEARLEQLAHITISKMIPIGMIAADSLTSRVRDR